MLIAQLKWGFRESNLMNLKNARRRRVYELYQHFTTLNWKFKPLGKKLMISFGKFIIIFPLITPMVTIEPNRISESIPYSSFSIEQPKYKNIMEYNTMTNEELIRENNDKIIQQLYKSLE